MNTRHFSLTLVIYLCDLISCVNLKQTDGPKNLSEYTEPHFRIVGGKPTRIDNFPFVVRYLLIFVSIQRRYQRHVCGGSYILPKFILSAAHCMVSRSKIGRLKPINPRVFIAVAGSTGVKSLHGSKIQIKLIDKVLPHPLYNQKYMHHDIGLYQLEEPFRITRFIYPSPIPNSFDNTLAKTKFPICTVIGWGKLKTNSNIGYGDILRQVQVPLVTIEKCRYQVHPIISEKSQLCAGVDEGGVDSCQGDSGGPMLCDDIQVGIVSWGIGCGNERSPGIYSRVDYYLDWINNTVTKNTASIFACNFYLVFHTLVNLTFILLIV